MPDSHRRDGADRRATALVLVLVLAFGAWTRWDALPRLFTNVDDIGVASTILDARRENTTAAMRAALQGAPGVRAKALRLADRVGLLPVAAALAPVAEVPRVFTYAPAQFLLTAPLVSEQMPYETLVRRGRLPSFVFGVLGVLLIALLARALGGADAGARMLVAGALAACSWEFWIYSAQMETYAIGVAGSAAMLWMVAGRANAGARDVTALEALALAAMPWLQYQFLFFLPGYAMARAWQAYGAERDARRAVVSLATLTLPATFSTALLYHFFLGFHASADAGINWNAGPQGEFLFRLPGGGAVAALTYAAHFFVTNTLRSAHAMVSFLPEQHPAQGALTVALGAFGVLGLWTIARERTPAARAVSSFVAVTALVWLALIVRDKITLSPTRHSLVLLPVIALAVAAGVARLGALAGRRLVVASLATALCIAGFAASYAGERDARRDPWSEASFAALLAETHPDLVVAHDCLWNLRLMQHVGAPAFDAGCITGPHARWVGEAPSATPARVLFINGSLPLSEERFDSLRALLDRTPKGIGSLGPWGSYTKRQVVADTGRREVEFSARTHPGRNALYATLLTLDPR